MFSHIMVGSNDIDRSKRFYDALFGSIGVNRLMELPSGFTLYSRGWGQPGEDRDPRRGRVR